MLILLDKPLLWGEGSTSSGSLIPGLPASPSVFNVPEHSVARLLGENMQSNLADGSLRIHHGAEKGDSDGELDRSSRGCSQLQMWQGLWGQRLECRMMELAPGSSLPPPLHFLRRRLGDLPFSRD